MKSHCQPARPSVAVQLSISSPEMGLPISEERGYPQEEPSKDAGAILRREPGRDDRM